MNILIIGASGLVGSYLLAEAARRGHNPTGTHYETPGPGTTFFSLRQPDAIDALLGSLHPDVVVLAAAWVWADGCEKDKEFANLVNLDAPAEIAAACFAKGIRLVFISSNYVFDGNGAPYSEEAPPSPVNHYGFTKLRAEQAIQEAMRGEALVVRTCGIFGDDPHGKNFLCQILRSLRRSQPIRVPCDQYQNATHAADLAFGILDLVSVHEKGVWNLAGADPDLRRDLLAKQIATTYSLDESLVVPVPTSELGQLARRPLRCGLRIDKASSRIGFSPAGSLLIPSLLEPR